MAVVCLFGFPAVACGQEPTTLARLGGQVRAQPDSQAVAGALVTVTPIDQEQEPQGAAPSFPVQVHTDEAGGFWVSVPPGTYRVRIEAFGFEPSERTGVGVSSGRPTAIRVYLRSRVFRLDEIVVAPSMYGFLEDPVENGTDGGSLDIDLGLAGQFEPPDLKLVRLRPLERQRDIGCGQAGPEKQNKPEKC